jgi:hypothetical protein
MKSTGLLIFIFFGISACRSDRSNIVDDYYIYAYSDFYDGENVLMCKLSCENDPVVKNVKRAEWNDSLIILETESNYFIIKSSSKYGLCCCCDNQKIGPMSKLEVDDFKHKAKFRMKDFKQIKK